MTDQTPAPHADQGDSAERLGTTLLALGRTRDLFQYPHSNEVSLKEIGARKSLEVRPADRGAARNDEWQLANTQPDRPGVESWIVQTPADRLGVISREGANVWVNVSDVGEGLAGSRVYDLAANYAVNSRIIFIGDPLGVSLAALRRRLENMLSSAVKYGTTEHLAPHVDQLVGNPSEGIAPLRWTPNDTIANIEAMVLASLATTEAAEPAANLITYHVHAREFRDANGSRLEPGDISRLLVQGGLRAAGGPGVATLQRAALFRTLLSGRDERQALLDAIRGQQGAGGACLDRSFY